MMGLRPEIELIPEDEQKMRKMSITNTPAAADKSAADSKYRGIYFGCVLLCRDKCSKNKGEKRYTWHQSEVTAIDGESAIQLHYAGSPLKYDRWMSLQSDWKDLAPLKYLSKGQIESGNPLDAEQATAVYDFLLTGELAEMNIQSETNNTVKADISEIISKNLSSSSMSSETQFKGLELFVGKKIEVMDFFQTKPNEEMKEKWRFAQVVDITSEFIRIHFSGWDPKWDENIDISSVNQRIRERRRKLKSIENVPVVERTLPTCCPHCGESLLTPPPPQQDEFQETPMQSRRSSLQGGRLMRAPSDDYSPVREGPYEESEIGASLSVDDRITIALKVADRRLSSIQCTRSLLAGSTSTEGSKEKVPTATPTAELRGMTRRGSYPPPEHSRITYDMYK